MYVILNFAYLAILRHYTQIIRLQTPLGRKCADPQTPPATTLPHFLTHFIFKNTPLRTVYTTCLLLSLFSLLLSLFSSCFYNCLSSKDISRTVNYRLQKVRSDNLQLKHTVLERYGAPAGLCSRSSASLFLNEIISSRQPDKHTTKYLHTAVMPARCKAFQMAYDRGRKIYHLCSQYINKIVK